MPVIDIHPHIVSPDTQRYPLAPLGGTQSTWSSERPTTYQTLLKAMDEAGVDKAAIVHSSTAYGYDNSYVADAVAAVPSRFTGVYSIDAFAPDAVKTFDAWLARGCTGMRLFTTGSTLPDQATWFVDPKGYPFWEHAAAKNIPVCMQMKQEGIPLLRQIMDRFPKVTIILDAAMMEHERLNFHPLANTMTTSIGREDLLKFLEATGHRARVVPISRA